VRSYYLRLRNDSRLRLVKNVVGYFLLIGKVFCVLLASSFVYFYLQTAEQTFIGKETSRLEFPCAPALTILIIGLWPAQVFLHRFKPNIIDSYFSYRYHY
jgi:Plasma-membrane choline transporter.